jgi:hypothetical protein
MQLKKFLVLAGSALTISSLGVSDLRAADSPDYLAIIAANTTNILTKVSNIPDYIQNATAYILNWQKSDTSQTTADMQVNFDVIGKATAQNLATQNAQQIQITADMLGINIGDLTTPKDNPAVLKTLPQVNNLSYATMLSMPPAPKGAASPYNYIKNAAGFSILHETPNAAWSGTPVAKAHYTGFFNTVNAVESYDAYILSGLWAEVQNGNQLTTAQNNLVAQASNSTWVAQIATEELGKVLRQILMFQSQAYVLLTQSLQIQKQQLAATAMTNTLLIANAQQTESLLSNKAQGLAG